MAFGTPGVQPDSTYRIAPANNRLQKNMYGTGYSEFMDYSAVDALPNPGYGGATGMPVGGSGNQDVNIDLLIQRMTDVLQNQFGLKPKSQGHVYTPPFLSYGPPWAHYLGGYQDRLLGRPLGLPDLCRTVPVGVRRKDYDGEVLR
jgi:hypothetical protein